nr:2-dehydro-3-deoxyglucarate aldolase [Planctomycetota bacterium]
ALVRVTEIGVGPIKRALDMGAHGVVLPLVRGRGDVEAGFAHGRYPPLGRRGVGGERSVKWGLGFDEYLACANEELLIIPLIETREAVEDIDAILAVPGLEAIFFGPADLSASYGHLGAWEGPSVAERILAVTAKARARGIAAGVVGRSQADMDLRRRQGFQMIAHGSECGLLIRALGASIEAQLGKRPVHLWF